jgi:hypothetical protein
MKVVSPYRPFVPESEIHLRLGAFDWPAAMGMLAASVQQACGCPTFGLTDATTDLPVPALRFQTDESRLMLWLLEVSVAYLDSAEFDQDTVFITPDVLVLRDLRPYFKGDLGLLVRTAGKYAARPLLNAMQWWPVAAQKKLVAFYQAALAVARVLPEASVTWGADSEALRLMLDPIRVGLQRRAGLWVRLYEANDLLLSLTAGMMADLDDGRQILTPASGVAFDFKGWKRKPYMGQVWQGLAA